MTDPPPSNYTTINAHPSDTHPISYGQPQCCFKATVSNPKGSVEKLSPKESVEGAH